MKIYVTYEKEESLADLARFLNKIKELELPPKVYLVSTGKFSWELALGLGVTGVVGTKRPFSEETVETARIPE